MSSANQTRAITTTHVCDVTLIQSAHLRPVKAVEVWESGDSSGRKWRCLHLIAQLSGGWGSWDDKLGIQPGGHLGVASWGNFKTANGRG